MNSWSEDRSGLFTRLYKWSSVIGGMDFSRSLFLVYFGSLGFSGTQTGLLQAMLFWSSFALELPSGVFADRFGRRTSALLGFACLVVTYAWLGSLKNFWPAAGAFLLWGAGFAFLSGAGPALLYDGLKEAGRLDTHLSWLGRVRSLSTLAMAGAILSGGLIYSWRPAAIFWSSSLCALAGMLLLLRIPEPRLHMAGAHEGVWRELLRFFRARHGRDLMIFLGGLGAIEMAQTPFFIFSQTMFHDAGLTAWQISMLLAFAFVIASAAQRLAPRFRSARLLHMVGAIGLFMATCLSLLWIQPGLWLQLVLFLAVSGIPHFVFVHTDQYVQDACDSRFRATLLSVQSFVNAVLIGISYLATGWLSDRLGMTRALSCLSIPVVIGVLLVAWHFANVAKVRDENRASA